MGKIIRSKFPSGAVWETFELDTDLITPPVIKLQIRPIKTTRLHNRFLGELADMKNEERDAFTEAVLNGVTRSAIDAVLDWDLEDEEGKTLPCNGENKTLIFDKLMWAFVKKEPEPEPEAKTVQEEEQTPSEDKAPGFQWLWFHVLEIAQDNQRFLKN